MRAVVAAATLAAMTLTGAVAGVGANVAFAEQNAAAQAEHGFARAPYDAGAFAAHASPAGPFALLVEWDAVEGATRYVVEIRSIDYDGEWREVYDGDALEHLLTLQSGEWDVRITAYETDEADAEPLAVGTASGTAGEPETSVTDVTLHSARIGWLAVAGAEGYAVSWFNTADPDDNGSTDVASHEDEVVATGLTADAEYETWISVLDADGYMILAFPGPVFRASPASLAVEVSSVGTGSANVWWPAVSGADHFVITVDDGRAPITQTPETVNVLRLEGLARGTSFRADVEAWATVEGVPQVIGRGGVEFTTLASFELNAVATGPTTVRVTWAPALTAETSLAGRDWAGPLQIGATELIDHSVLPGETFWYELLGERVEVRTEVGSMSPTVSDVTPSSASFAWPAVYGGSLGVTGERPRAVTYTVFLDGVEVGTTEGLTIEAGGLSAPWQRMTVEASVVANVFDGQDFQEDVRVVIARGGVDRAAAAAPAGDSGTRALAEAGVDPLPFVIAGAVLLAGGVLAAVGTAVRRARVRR